MHPCSDLFPLNTFFWVHPYSKNPRFASVSIFLFLSFLFLLRKWKKYSNSKQTKKLPPGPWKHPFIGSMHHLAGGLPHRVLRDLAEKYGPLMHLQLGDVSAIVVTSPDMAKQVLKTHDIAFASRPKLLAMDIICYDRRDIAFSPYGECEAFAHMMYGYIVMSLLICFPSLSYLLSYKF
ncbi:hypothetical protein R3W88_012005 [Solanum pinnatisectum]|uniref:Uncharacterized protein n=1 Tax=Solanum pinnatisectum TaxID=50273 RepID=A0AAV9L923_9SOLN|nr:hypothetical protein R3W88_012005 [Solanum pinnatisectum]